MSTPPVSPFPPTPHALGGQDYLPLSPDQRVAVLVNSLGATPPMELLLIARRAASNLTGRGARVERVFCGSFMTSLDMAGASVTVMRVDALSLARCVHSLLFLFSLFFCHLDFHDASCVCSFGL